MNKHLAFPAIALAALSLAGCTTLPPAVPTAPQATQGYPEGTPVGLGVPVLVGQLVVTPKKIVEDSRCPINARCVWAGRLIVKTQIDGEGWRDTADITLGETYGTHGKVIALVSGEPGKTTQAETPPEAYRFVYEPR